MDSLTDKSSADTSPTARFEGLGTAVEALAGNMLLWF
jgi:hypothetical protein